MPIFSTKECLIHQKKKIFIFSDKRPFVVGLRFVNTGNLISKMSARFAYNITSGNYQNKNSDKNGL